jgi:hypothetical protein
MGSFQVTLRGIYLRKLPARPAMPVSSAIHVPYTFPSKSSVAIFDIKDFTFHHPLAARTHYHP